MNNNENNYRPSLSFYHPNPKGTGAALKLTLHPAHDCVDGYIAAEMAGQNSLGDARRPNPVYPTFDFEHAIMIKLDFSDLSKMLQVFRGECESIGDGRRIYHRTIDEYVVANLSHLIEPVPGYRFVVRRSGNDRSTETSSSIILSSDEATGLVCAIESSMSRICFGD